MHRSKYAPQTPREALLDSKVEKQKQEKAKATRLLGRLQWKAQSLVASYIRARDIVNAGVQQNGQPHMREELEYAFMLGTNSEQAERMFKVDFFEFYALLERYIVVCLGIVGVHVSEAPRVNVNVLVYITNPVLQRTRPDAMHSFHANMLEALDEPSCPLHTSLGGREVRIQLGHAKDYRNAWKDADDAGRSDETRRKLPDFDLHQMLYHILDGCAKAHGVVQGQATPDLSAVTSRDFEQRSESYDGAHAPDAPLEFMDDAMEVDG
ncbi:hypothetical protein K458DRAFT_321685 [Lentithecium fluviatile CBS 122367]|uniref:Uncharacterized protein n=1 Tax=Lentithecium fluviatile CBS 122367 TaxID=1168545 RepID=A0A6G1IEI1_9PLEO|nr:hypothetical protein K458DRAFT_321685 [Lentithecium fluviatile CBS 122367]